MDCEKEKLFDSLCTSDEINILKILTFYIKSPMKDFLVPYIFLSEYHQYQRNKQTHSSSSSSTPHYFFEDIEPYCQSNPTLHQFFDFEKKIEQIKDMMDLLTTMQQLNEDESNPFSEFSINSENGLSIEDLLQIIEAFQKTN